MSLEVPAAPEDLTPDWFTAALSAAGVLRRGVVTAATWERVGQEYGFTGLVGRVELRYELAGDDPPRSLVAKLPMARGETVSGHRAAQQRDPVLARRYFERCVREVRFYHEIGGSPAPRLLYSAVDEARQRVVLLLEDLTGWRQGDVLRGCSIDDAALVVEELAHFHARWWGERAPDGSFPRSDGDGQARQERFDARAGPFLELNGAELPGEVRDLVERLRTRLAAVLAELHDGPRALIHGDLHLDNLLFGGAGRGVAMLDWQTTCVGSPASDVSFFVFDSLSAVDRRAAEDALLGRYLSLLELHGVRDYAGSDLKRDCRLALLSLLAGTVGWLVSIDRKEVTKRERALQDNAIAADGRLVSALLDHDVGALLE